MTELRDSRVKEAIASAEGLYHRLVLVVGNSGSGKTDLIREVAEDVGVTAMNINLGLSEKILELTHRQRSLRLPGLLSGLLAADDPIAILDNTEILFDQDLKQDPLRLLQGLSRNRTVIASWNGTAKGTQLTYAEPGHPEYRKYEHVDIPIVLLAESKTAAEIEQSKEGGRA